MKRSIVQYSILIVISLLLSFAAYSQNKRTILADEAFKGYQFTTAIKLYKKGYSREKNKEEKNRIVFQIAECFRLMNNYQMAETNYKRLISSKYDVVKPEIYLHLGNIMKVTGRLKEAKESYEKFLLAKPDDKDGLFALKALNAYDSIMSNPSRHKVELVGDLSGQFNDFGAVYSNPAFNEVVFASDRPTVKGKKARKMRKDEWTGKSFSDLFGSKEQSNGKFALPQSIDVNEAVNTTANEGTPFFNNRFNSMYFTRCTTEEKKLNGCKIMVSRRAGQSWGEAQLVDLGGDSTTIIGHPTLTDDEMTIYFSADLPGGKGGKDIWVATRTGRTGKFGKPRNLGETINTPGDELFPFIRYDSILYFSSNGHIGLGGLDIFKSVKLSGDGKVGWSKPVNLGPPVNSTYDDFNMTFHPEAMEQGFFASNRPKGRGGDDIYSFLIQPLEFTLRGIVKDDRTLQPLGGVLVQLKGSDGFEAKSTTSEKGEYNFNKNQIKVNVKYHLTVSKDGYFTVEGDESTIGYENSKDLVHDFVLVPVPKKPVVLPEILYDLGRWELKPQYQDSLQGLIKILEANPNIIIELGAHTDARDTEERNDVLSQKRAQSVVDYLIIRGIEPDRLVAKGYGERNPRILQKDFIRSGYTFKNGVRLTESFIDSLPSRDIKEAAHQLNRRTEFMIIGTHFKSSGKKEMTPSEVKLVTGPERNAVPFKYEGKLNNLVIQGSFNNFILDFVYEPNLTDASMSGEMAVQMLRDGAIGKEDFQNGADDFNEDGTLKKGAILTISQFRVGKNTLYDIEVVIDPKQKVPLYLNNKIMTRFGAFSIDETNKEIVFE